MLPVSSTAHYLRFGNSKSELSLPKIKELFPKDVSIEAGTEVWELFLNFVVPKGNKKQQLNQLKKVIHGSVESKQYKGENKAIWAIENYGLEAITKRLQQHVEPRLMRRLRCEKDRGCDYETLYFDNQPLVKFELRKNFADFFMSLSLHVKKEIYTTFLARKAHEILPKFYSKAGADELLPHVVTLMESDTKFSSFFSLLKLVNFDDGLRDQVESRLPSTLEQDAYYFTFLYCAYSEAKKEELQRVSGAPKETEMRMDMFKQLI